MLHTRGPIIKTYEDPHQGPGTKFLKSGTVPEIRGPLRPMKHYKLGMLESLACRVFTVWTSTSLFLARLNPWKG